MQTGTSFHREWLFYPGADAKVVRETRTYFFSRGHTHPTASPSGLENWQIRIMYRTRTLDSLILRPMGPWRIRWQYEIEASHDVSIVSEAYAETI